MLPFALLAMTAAVAQVPPVVPLWEGKAPHAVGDSATDQPSLTVYLPERSKATGTAVVVCPGGGYTVLAADHEGKQVAEWLNERGVAAFVLKYRVANAERPGPLHPAPLADARRAIQLVKARAAEYGVDPGRVGIWGFSAGGHLASSAATHPVAGDPKAGPQDPARQSSNPAFLILAYPVISMEDGLAHGGSRRNLFGDKPDPQLLEAFSTDKRVTKDTPPTFIFHTNADTAVRPEHAIRFYLACHKAGVPVELHIYERGRHGVGLGRDPKWTGGERSVATWPDRLADWMKARGLLDPPRQSGAEPERTTVDPR